MKTFAARHGLLTAFIAMLLISPGFRVYAQSSGTPATQTKPTSSEAATPEDSSIATETEMDENEKYRQSPSVKKMGAMLGMNPAQSAVAFEVTNFAILAVLVGVVLVKVLPKTFRDRNTAIQKDLVDARTATEEASIRLGGVEARLARLDDEIAALRAQAEKASAADEKRIAASVEEEKQKILAAAEQEIAAATTHARRELQKYAAELAIEQAARKLVITAETDRLLVQNFARRLGGTSVDDDSKEGQN